MERARSRETFHSHMHGTFKESDISETVDFFYMDSGTINVQPIEVLSQATRTVFRRKKFRTNNLHWFLSYSTTR